MDVCGSDRDSPDPPATITNIAELHRFRRHMLIKQIVDDTKNNIKAKIAMQAEIDAAEDDEAAEVDMNVPAAITAWSAPATVIPDNNPSISQQPAAAAPAVDAISASPANQGFDFGPASRPAGAASSSRQLTPFRQAVVVPGPFDPPVDPSAPIPRPQILLPSYPSAKNGFRGGPVLKSCNAGLSKTIAYIEISDDSEDESG